MKADKLEKYLDELSEGTDFDFRISEIKTVEGIFQKSQEKQYFH